MSLLVNWTQKPVAYELLYKWHYVNQYSFCQIYLTMGIGRIMSKVVTTIRVLPMLLFILFVCAVGLFIFSPIPIRKGYGPYTDYVIEDVSKPQQFIIPSKFINPVVVRYRIECVLDKSAVVSFRTETAEYVHIPLKGVVADSAVHDFYETKDMLIIYQPTGTKKGHLIIKAALNW